MPSLHCWAFCSCCKQGLLFFPCWDFSLRCLLFLWSTGFNSCDIQAQLLYGMWDLPEPGIKLMSNALASRFFFFFFFNWRIISLCIDHRYTSIPSLLNLPPTPLHPLRLSQSTSLSSLCHTANSRWLPALHMVMYMFPCYSLNSTEFLTTGSKVF